MARLRNAIDFDAIDSKPVDIVFSAVARCRSAQCSSQSAAKLLLLDEPSLGLAPLVVKSILEAIVHLKDLGLGILLVEQNARAALALADRGYVLNMGQVAAKGSARDLSSDAEVQRSYLGYLS